MVAPVKRPIEALARTRSSLAAAGGVILMAAVFVNSVEAQGTDHRRGFWAQGGVMAASNRSDCSNCNDFAWDDGVAVFLRAGGTISPHVLMGAELYGFRQTDGESTETDIQGLMAIAEWYPWLHLGGFVKVGIGVANLDLFVSTIDGGSTQSSKTGMAISLGFGWDIRVTDGISVTPVVNTYINAVGNLDIEPVGTADNVLTTLLTAGVGVTFH
jgi:hypothetical protein